MQEWLQCNNGSNNGVGRGRDLQQLLGGGELDAARADALAAAQLPPAEAREKADAWMREVWGDRARLAQRTNLLRAKYARTAAENSTDNSSTSNSNT